MTTCFEQPGESAPRGIRASKHASCGVAQGWMVREPPKGLQGSHRRLLQHPGIGLLNPLSKGIQPTGIAMSGTEHRQVCNTAGPLRIIGTDIVSPRIAGHDFLLKLNCNKSEERGAG